MTYQLEETLILDGEETSMGCVPKLPPDHPRIYSISQSDADTLSTLIEYTSSACWRGYKGTWEVRHGQFYLIDLKGFKRLHNGPPIFADWFSGTISLPRGQDISERFPGYISAYSHELQIIIEHGLVTSRKVVDHSLSEAGAFLR